MAVRVPLVKFKEIAEVYPDKIVSNRIVETPEGLDPSKNLLVSLVKNDTIDLLLDGCGVYLLPFGSAFASHYAVGTCQQAC